MNALIILARYNSQRLYGKALKPLNRTTLLGTVFSALDKQPQFIVLATSNSEEDDLLVEEAEKAGIAVFRGHLNNVAKRVADCINKFGITNFARLNGDSPFVPIELLNNAFDLIDAQDLDLVTNIYPRSFPYGMSLEVIKSKTFLQNIDFFSEKEQEHITSFFYKNIHLFKFKNIESGFRDLTNIILTVDDEKGYALIKSMFERDAEIQRKSIQQIVSLYHNVSRDIIRQ
jgi:spore coat polysaccharide biosynthesis protein SpsF (cytidylyltransferase family)